MSHPISSLAWLQRALASPPSSAGRSERSGAAVPPAPVAPVAAAAPVSAVQQLGAAVQTVVASETSAPSTAAVTDTTSPSADADSTVQRFAQALMVALHRLGREGGDGRDDDGDHEHHHRGRHEGHHHGRDSGHGREHEGLRAYRSMDNLAQRLGALATQLRQGAAPVATPGAGTTRSTAVEPVIDTAAPTDMAAASSTTVPSSAATPPTPKPDPLQRLLDAFSLLTTPAAPSSGAASGSTPVTDAASPRERLAGFLDQLASLLSAPGRRAANDGCGCSTQGSLLNLAA